jgi:diadenosine tetraphosphatase ApaH/serine/threonine PP2A family protein phosphatase
MCSPYANEILEIIRSLPNTHVIRGNEEDYLKRLDGQDQQAWTDGQFQGLYWCYQTISRENHEYLAALPGLMSISGENAGIFAAHSSATFIGNVEFGNFSSSKISDRYENKPVPRLTLLGDIKAYLEKDAELQQRLTTLPDGIYVFGHTHVQWHARFQDKLFINPGSCGLPLDGEKAAAYTILDETGDGIVLERRVPYDVEAFIANIRNSSLYSQAAAWCDLAARERLTAFEHVDFFLRFIESYAKKKGDHIRPYSAETWSGAYYAFCERLEHQTAYLVTDYYEFI